VGHCELCFGAALKSIWYFHGKVLLGHVVRCRERWEYGMVVARVQRIPEDVARSWAMVIGTIHQRDHNRNILGALQGVLGASFSVRPRLHNSTRKGPTYWLVNLNGEPVAGSDHGTREWTANFDTLPECAAGKEGEGEERCKLHWVDRYKVE
jgi:hypothetical protein